MFVSLKLNATASRSHLSNGGVLLKCGLVVCHPPWHWRLGGVGVYDPSGYEGWGRLWSSDKPKGTKNGSDGPGERRSLDRRGEGGMPVDLEDCWVELEFAIIRYLHVHAS